METMAAAADKTLLLKADHGSMFTLHSALKSPAKPACWHGFASILAFRWIPV